MSLFRYPGGKNKLLEHIHAKLGLYNLKDYEYREPFFGGGSVGLSVLQLKNAPRKIWLNDKDIGIACLWTAIINFSDELKERILDFSPSVEAFYSIKDSLLKLDQLPETKDQIVDIALKKIAIHQISYSGLGVKSGGPLGGQDQKSQYKIDCRWSPQYLCKKIDKINKLFKDVWVRDAVCMSQDFQSVIENDDSVSFIYLDPPYYEKGNELYQHGFSSKDHERLADTLKQTQHKWLLSYDDCNEIRELYSWAHIEVCIVKYSINGAREKKELLIYAS